MKYYWREIRPYTCLPHTPPPPIPPPGQSANVTWALRSNVSLDTPTDARLHFFKYWLKLRLFADDISVYYLLWLLPSYCEMGGGGGQCFRQKSNVSFILIHKLNRQS
jgi:hypothetical protein